MSAQHTPGPWLVAWEESKNPDRILVQSGDGVDVAGAFFTLEQNGCHTGNARLIAAAPDLYAALVAVAKLRGTLTVYQLDAQVDAALAKVTAA